MSNRKRDWAWRRLLGADGIPKQRSNDMTWQLWARATYPLRGKEGRSETNYGRSRFLWWHLRQGHNVSLFWRKMY